MNNINYRQNEKGGWDIYLDNIDFGVSLYIPSGHKPEDYNIKFNFSKDGEKIMPIRKCVNVVIELLNPPETTKEIVFNQTAGVHFVDNLMLCIRERLRMEANERLVIGASVDHSPDGFRRITRDSLDFFLNTGTSLTFCKRDSEKELSEPPKLVPNVLNGHIEQNKNIDYTLVDSGGILFISNNKYNTNKENNHKNLSVDLDADHSIFIYNNFDCLKRESEINNLSLKADAAQWAHTMCHIHGENKIIVEPLNEKKPTLLTTSSGIILNVVNATMRTKTNELALLNRNALHTLEICGSISLLGKKKISLATAARNLSLVYSKIENQYGSLNLLDSSIHSVDAQLSNGNNKQVSINSSVIETSTIRGHQGNIVSSNFSNVMMNNCNFAEETRITLAKGLDVDFHGYYNTRYEIDNLELKNKSTLSIGDPDAFVFWPENTNYQLPKVKVFSMNIINTVVSGNSNLNGFPLSELNNSLLEDAKIYCSLPEAKINNTILKNSASLKYISEVNNSEIDDSQITAKKPMAISDQFLQNKKIEDYEKFLNLNCEYLANDIGCVTNEISSL